MEEPTVLDIIDKQRAVLQQIAEMTQATRQWTLDLLKLIAAERHRRIDRAQAMAIQADAESERLGLVDLAPVSPILGPRATK